MSLRYFTCVCVSARIRWIGLVGFHGISTIEGYFMPNPFYIKYAFFDNIFKHPKLILLQTAK